MVAVAEEHHCRNAEEVAGAARQEVEHPASSVTGPAGATVLPRPADDRDVRVARTRRNWRKGAVCRVGVSEENRLHAVRQPHGGAGRLDAPVGGHSDGSIDEIRLVRRWQHDDFMLGDRPLQRLGPGGGAVPPARERGVVAERHAVGKPGLQGRVLLYGGGNGLFNGVRREKVRRVAGHGVHSWLCPLDDAVSPRGDEGTSATRRTGGRAWRSPKDLGACVTGGGKDASVSLCRPRR